VPATSPRAEPQAEGSVESSANIDPSARDRTPHRSVGRVRPDASAAAIDRMQFVRPVALLMAAQVLDKSLYLVREGMVTARFGASALTDAFAVGLYVSNFILALLRPLVEDALIPVYVERLAADSASAQRLLKTVGLLILVATGVAAILVLVFAPELARFVAPGFSADASALTAQMVRTMALFTLVLGLTNFSLSVLSAHRAYLLVGLSPLSATAIVILSLWFLSERWGIHSLTWGLVAGTLVQLALLAAGLWRRQLLGAQPDMPPRPAIGRPAAMLRPDDGLAVLARFTGLMMIVRFLSMSVGWLDRSLGSRLAEGSVAALAFAINVYQLPLQVCTLAVTTVVIVQFSWHVARKDTEQLGRDLNLALRIAAFFLIPASVALIVLREPIVRVLYERGLFDAQDTAMTASLLLFYTLGLFPQSVAFVVVRLFLARKEAHLVLLIFVVATAVHVLLDLVLVGPLQQAGIALATSAGVTSMAATGLLLARHRLGPLGGRALLISFARNGLAAAGMGLGLYAVLQIVSLLPTVGRPTGVWAASAWVLAACTAVGLAVYLAIAYLFKTPELRILIASVIDRSPSTSDQGRRSGREDLICSREER
jgi:putative peptidoglycan lipid II flippase